VSWRVKSIIDRADDVCLLRSVIDCHPIDTLYQSIVGITISYVNSSASTTYGSLVSATCRRGTVAVGDTVWRCDHNGLWSTPVNFQCHRKSDLCDVLNACCACLKLVFTIFSRYLMSAS